MLPHLFSICNKSGSIVDTSDPLGQTIIEKFELHSDVNFAIVQKQLEIVAEMNMRYGDSANLITHGKGKEVDTNHYFDVDSILDDMFGKQLYKPKNLTPGSYTKAK